MSLQQPIPSTSYSMEAAHSNRAAAATPAAIADVVDELEQLSIGLTPAATRSLDMFDVAPVLGLPAPLVPRGQLQPPRYYLHPGPACRNTRFWVVGDTREAEPAPYTLEDNGAVMQDTNLVIAPPPPPTPTPTPPKPKQPPRPAPLLIITAAEFAELRATLQRSQLTGAAGAIAAGVCQLAQYTPTGRHTARFANVRVPACVALDTAVVLGRAVARVPTTQGGERLVVFCLVLPPLSRRRVLGPGEISKIAAWTKDDESGSLSSVFLHLAMVHGVSVRPLRPAPSAHGMALLAGLETLRSAWDEAVETLVLAEYFDTGVHEATDDCFRRAERAPKKPRVHAVEPPSSAQLCRVLGYLDRLGTSDIDFDPAGHELKELRDTLATCIPSAEVEAAERESWMAWARENGKRKLVVGWAFADGAEQWVLSWNMAEEIGTATWQPLVPPALAEARTFAHLALGVSGMCTRSLVDRVGKQWFVTLLPGLESRRGRRAPGDVARPVPPKVAAKRAGRAPRRWLDVGGSGGGELSSGGQKSDVADQADEQEESQRHETATMAVTEEVVYPVEALPDADDKDMAGDVAKEDDTERTLVDETGHQDIQFELFETPQASPRHNAAIDDAGPISRPGSPASTPLGSPRPLSPLTELSDSSSDESKAMPLAFMRRLGGSTAVSSRRSSSSALARNRQLSSAAVSAQRESDDDHDDAVSLDGHDASSDGHDASDHSTTSSVLSSTTSSPSSYGIPAKNRAGSSGSRSSSSEDVPLAAVRRPAVRSERDGSEDSSSEDVPLASTHQSRPTAAMAEDHFHKKKRLRRSRLSRNVNMRSNSSSTSDDEPLALARALQNRLAINREGHSTGKNQPSKRPLKDLSSNPDNDDSDAEPRAHANTHKRPKTAQPALLPHPRANRRPAAPPRRVGWHTAYSLDTSSEDEKVPLSVALRRRFGESSDDEPLRLAAARKRLAPSVGSSSDDVPLSSVWRKKQRQGGN